MGSASLIHDLDLKRYVESYDFDHGFDPGYRVMPTGLDLVHPYRLGRNNLALAATEGGYYSLTGLTHPVVARRYREVVPSGIFGAIPLDWIRWATNSRFLDFFAVRYALAIGPEHKAALEAASQLKPARESADVAIYENPDVLPMSFLASATTADTDWSRDPRQVYVDGFDQHRWAAGEIVSTELHEHGRIDIKLVTRGEALLVASFLNFPGWQVRIDEAAPSEPLTVNGLAMGVVVPAGLHRVSFRYHPPGLTAGLWLGAGGGLLFLALLAWERHDSRREP